MLPRGAGALEWTTGAAGVRATIACMRSLAALVVCVGLSGFAGGCKRVPEGCGRVIPEAELWALRSEQELAADLAHATQCGRARDTRVLLEFTADWCPDCRVMSDVEKQGEAAAVLRERYERVRVHVGHWDRHDRLREQYGVRSIATFVVLDPNTGARVAQTTVEPVTGGTGPMTPARWAAWLRNPSTPAAR
jgi:thioredoxin 1